MERRDLLRWGLGGGLLATSGALLKSLLWPAAVSEAERSALQAMAEALLPQQGGRAWAGLPELIAELARRADAQRELRRLVRRGIAWVEDAARGAGAQSFAALARGERSLLLGKAQSEPEGSVPRVFVDRLRIEVFSLYYSRAEILAAFGLPAPPQPAGFPDYQAAP